MAENHVLLETIELTQSASSVVFDNIPQTGYDDLKIVASTRCSRVATDVEAYIKFNANSSNYSYRVLFGTGSTVGSQNSATFPPFLTNCTSASVNTFSSTDIYIPNYTQSVTKSMSIESVAETNAVGITQFLVSGQWANTAAITSIELYPFSGSWVEGSTFSLYGIAASGTTPITAPYATGGNMVATDGTYWYHTFLTSGYFTPQKELTNVDYLVVAGGGGGGGDVGGGGGAGGLRSTVTATGGGGSLESKLSLSATPYGVIIGAGGTGGVAGRGNQGNNSTFSTITSTGGGYGGRSGTAGGVGGSGGGGSGRGQVTGFTGSGGAGTSNQGYAGGNGVGDSGVNGQSGGGGGGAGSAGTNGVVGTGGNGGAGVAVAITGSSVTYAGGGAGPVYTPPTNGSGGSGGGGSTGSAGTTNTGGGGGGAIGGTTTGGAGGSGIVVIRYAIA